MISGDVKPYSRGWWSSYRRRHLHTWRLTFSAVAFVFCSLLAFQLLLETIPWSWRPGLVLAAYAPFLQGSFIVAIAAAALAWTRTTAIVVATALVSTLVVGVATSPFRSNFSSGTDSVLVKVMQVDLNSGHAAAASVVAAVAREHPRLMTAVGLTSNESTALLSAGISTYLPYHAITPGPDASGGVGMWSVTALGNPSPIDGFGPGRSQSVSVNEQSLTQLTVITVDLDSPLDVPVSRWTAELRSLDDAVDPLSGFTVIAGDFHASPGNAQYEHFQEKVDHLYDEGCGSSDQSLLTYPSDRWYPPLFAVDHVLNNDGSCRVGNHTLTIAGATHRALVVTVGF